MHYGGIGLIKENLEAVNKRIADAAARVGRTDKITLVAVTKNHPVEMMEEAAKCGVTDVGENRVQEALQKLEAFPDNHLTWHLIGHLQTNKAKHAVEHFDLIHSIDSPGAVAGAGGTDRPIARGAGRGAKAGGYARHGGASAGQDGRAGPGQAPGDLFS